MASINPLAIRPAELMRILNTAGFGTVLTDTRLMRHRNHAGYTIGTEKTINLFQYAAWLTLEYMNPKDAPADYDEKKRRMAEKSAEMVRTAQDIGDLPPVADLERKEQSIHSFKFFCESYFRDVFYLTWSQDHLKVIEKIERAVKTGGLFAVAMPRATGKTSLCLLAVVWASFGGWTPFVCLVAASAEKSRDLLETIKTWLETNELLLADFPEICYPIRCLERIVHRQKGQKYHGQPTRIEWVSDRVVLPTIDGSAGSGVVISCSGMKGSDIRGQQYARPDGQIVRPQLVLIDDPQTSESAWSQSQSMRREGILAGDVLGMAGPGKKIAGLMACTVIRPGDMADNILDREKHPDWQGERTKLIYAFPSSERLWARYCEIRADSLRNDGDGSEATKYYAEHRDEMDAGARVAWPERFNEDELSAIQHAMNLKMRDEAAFMAEYQNEPIVDVIGEEMMSAEEIAEKTNGHQRGVVPHEASHLTMFVDVQQKALFWLIAAWESNFNGFVVDYGTWPDQQRQYFTLRDLQRTIAAHAPGAGLEGSIYSALESLAEERLDRAYHREDGSEMRIERCLVDANWGQTTDVVYQFCRQSRHAAVLTPSHGMYVGASSVPFSDYRRQKGDRVGQHWRIPNTTGKRAVRHALIDTNFWKSFVHHRLAVRIGDPGCLSLFGHEPKVHTLLAEHFVSEYRIKTMANDRVVDEWKLRASRPDNHWFDCLVGCAVGASIQGCELAILQTRQKRERKRYVLSEIMQERGIHV